MYFRMKHYFRWCSAAWNSRNRESLYKHYVTMHLEPASTRKQQQQQQQRQSDCTRSSRITLVSIVSVRSLLLARERRRRGRCAYTLVVSVCGRRPALLSRMAFPDIYTCARAQVFLFVILPNERTGWVRCSSSLGREAAGTYRLLRQRFTRVSPTPVLRHYPTRAVAVIYSPIP